MVYLYGIKADGSRRLVATFDSEPLLRSYVRWATLSEADGVHKFEQGSPLVGYQQWRFAQEPDSPEDAAADVPHGPSPSML